MWFIGASTEWISLFWSPCTVNRMTQYKNSVHCATISESYTLISVMIIHFVFWVCQLLWLKDSQLWWHFTKQGFPLQKKAHHPALLSPLWFPLSLTLNWSNRSVWPPCRTLLTLPGQVINNCLFLHDSSCCFDEQKPWWLLNKSWHVLLWINQADMCTHLPPGGLPSRPFILPGLLYSASLTQEDGGMWLYSQMSETPKQIN